MNTSHISQLAFDFPIARTHCGLLLGNGRFGAMIWGNDRLHVTVNRADFWDHRGGELIVPGNSYRQLVEVARNHDAGPALENAILKEPTPANVFKPQRLPLGRFEFSFPDGVRPVVATLKYATGTITVGLSNHADISIDLGLHEDILLVGDDSHSIAGVSIRPAWDFEQSHDWLKQYDFSPPMRIETTELAGWIQSCPSDYSLAALCAKREDGFAIALEMGQDDHAAHSGALKRLSTIDPANLHQTNQAWWNRYEAAIPQIDIPNEFLAKFYRYALHKFAAATHPCGCACALQGPWHEEYQKAMWSGDYHFNVNVQQIYSLSFPIGQLEHLIPLFDMIESPSFQQCLRHNAQTLFGVTDGLWFTHAVDDRGYQCGWLVPGSILDPACGAWTALLYWNYYRYSGDVEFLGKRAMPFICGIMRCYEEMIQEHDGRLSIPLAVSAEYGFVGQTDQVGRDPSYQLAAVHMLLNILSEACRRLNIPPKPQWRDIQRRLPAFTTIAGKETKGESERRIAIWQGQDLDVCHRHHSHLACIYPFDSLPDDMTEQDQQIIENSLDHWVLMGMGQWSEWCIPWAAIIQARMKWNESPAVLLNLWREIYVNEGLNTVYLPRFRGVVAHRRHDLKCPKETSEIMQLDGTMGAATAVLEMLVHEHGGVVRLFAGIPDSWTEVSFKNIRLPGGFLVSAQRQAGKLKQLQVHSRFGGRLTIELDGQVQPFDFHPQETRFF